MKRLYLVRHAKSSWKDATLSDMLRPLNKRGLRDAPEIGRRLRVATVSIDRLLSSPAQRALSTAQTLARAIDFNPKLIIEEPELYFAGANASLQLIQSTDSACASLMLVGHNPDMTSLLNLLCGHQVGNMPTCAIASIQFNSEWSEVQAESGSLIDYDYPKNPQHL